MSIGSGYHIGTVVPYEAIARSSGVDTGATVVDGEMKHHHTVTSVGGLVEIIVIAIVGKDNTVPYVTVAGIVDIEVRSVAIV